MFNPYILMTLLYLFVAVLAALDASLTSFNLLPWFNGLRWLRVHFITLGMVTEAIFGALPIVFAMRRGQPQPRTRWDIWLTLNAGLLILLAGIPSMIQPLIFTGGTLIFIAATLLAFHLWQLATRKPPRPSSGSLQFYLTGFAYLLLGIIVGTGLWLGWSGPLRIQVPLEVHIHANNWGFLSLCFAGLLIDLIPALSKKALAAPRTLTLLFWGMALGAAGLVLGPWLGGPLWLLVPGLVLHITATIGLVIILGRALAGAGQIRTAGAWHLLTAYVWILLPVLIAPFALLQVPGFAGGDIEATAPQALIYGWVLQVGAALIPFLVGRYLLREATTQLGGTWLSLLAINLGSALVWASIFIIPLRATLHGTAYAFYVLAMLPVVWQVGALVRDWFKSVETGTLAAVGDD